MEFAVTSSGEVDVKASPILITFNSTTWNDTVAVTVRLVENNKFESFVRRNHSLTHAVSSPVDRRYDRFRAPNITIHIADDDSGCATAAAKNTSLETQYEYSCMNGGVCRPLMPRWTSPYVFSDLMGSEDCDEDVWGHRCQKPRINTQSTFGNRPYLSGSVCDCPYNYGGQQCQAKNTKFRRLAILVESKSPFLTSVS